MLNFMNFIILLIIIGCVTYISNKLTSKNKMKSYHLSIGKWIKIDSEFYK